MKRLLLFLSALALLATTCPIQATIHDVTVGNNFFAPLGTIVQPGDTVRWTWVGGIPHSTTSDGTSPKQWDSGITSAADHVFMMEFAGGDGPGPFPYHCDVHPITMKDTIFVDVQAGVEELISPNLPEGFALNQNYPNPFNPSTTIKFELPSRSFVSVKVFNLLGREVADLVSESLPAGTYQTQWDGRNHNGQESASGIYYYRLTAGAFVQSKKMVLIK